MKLYGAIDAELRRTVPRIDGLTDTGVSHGQFRRSGGGRRPGRLRYPKPRVPKIDRRSTGQVGGYWLPSRGRPRKV